LVYNWAFHILVEVLEVTAGRLLEWIGELLRKGLRCVVHISIGGGRINKIEMTEEVDLK